MPRTVKVETQPVIPRFPDEPATNTALSKPSNEKTTPVENDSYSPASSRSWEHLLHVNKPAKELLTANEGKIAVWESKKKTFSVFPWPMSIWTLDENDDPRASSINLAAKNGVLQKYDTAFGGNSRDHEEKLYYKCIPGSSHQHNVFQVATMLEEPSRDAHVGDQVFSPHETKGLLVKVSDSLIGDYNHKGGRYGDPEDFLPEFFLNDVLLNWAFAQNRPFVLDVERWRTDAVLISHAYDQGSISTSALPPAEFDVGKQQGVITYYHVELNGADVPDEARNFRFWIARDKKGAALKSDWIKTKDAPLTPLFAWQPKPRADLNKRSTWVTSNNQSNPEVRAENVYDIYMQSIGRASS